MARLRQGIDSEPGASGVVLTSSGGASGRSISPIPGLTIFLSADDDVTVTISAELKEEISADLATGESISDLIGQILDASGEEAEDVGAAADITAASLALAGGIWDEVSAACTVKDTGDVMFTAGPTQLACGDFELTLA